MNICNTLQSNLFYTAHQQTMKMSPLDLKEKRLSINRETNMVIRSMKRTDKGPNETLKTDINIYTLKVSLFSLFCCCFLAFSLLPKPHTFLLLIHRHTQVFFLAVETSTDNITYNTTQTMNKNDYKHEKVKSIQGDLRSPNTFWKTRCQKMVPVSVCDMFSANCTQHI